MALIVETSLASGRDILRGIARYVRERGHWSIFHEPRSLEQSAPAWLRRWDGDGIIARLQNERIAAAVLATGVPAVDVLGVVEGAPLPLVHVDDAAIGRLGAEHLLERGFRHFGFFGLKGENWSCRRGQAFRERIVQAGFPCALRELPRRRVQRASREALEGQLQRWVEGLVKPVGVMIASDQLGPPLLEACRRAGAEVPYRVAVIGVDNDEPLCEVSDPPLTSILPAHARVGYEAARLLDRLMEGESPPKDPVRVKPGSVQPRQSTDVLSVEDRLVAGAVRYIRENACRGIGVPDVIRSVPLSRSVLQRRFRSVFGHTIHDEIIRTRLNRAVDLLSGTGLPLAIVAERTGFKHQEYMGAVFRGRLGRTPGEYRRTVVRQKASSKR